MKLRIIVALVLVAAIAVAVWEAGILRSEYADALEYNEMQTRQLQDLKDEAAQLQQTLENLNDDSARENKAQADQLLQDAEALRAQMETLQSEIETMKTYLEENQDAIADAQAELTILRGVYDALEEGLAQVEEYIAGN